MVAAAAGGPSATPALPPLMAVRCLFSSIARLRSASASAISCCFWNRIRFEVCAHPEQQILVGERVNVVRLQRQRSIGRRDAAHDVLVAAAAGSSRLVLVRLLPVVGRDDLRRRGIGRIEAARRPPASPSSSRSPLPVVERGERHEDRLVSRCDLPRLQQCGFRLRVCAAVFLEFRRVRWYAATPRGRAAIRFCSSASRAGPSSTMPGVTTRSRGGCCCARRDRRHKDEHARSPWCLRLGSSLLEIIRLERTA